MQTEITDLSKIFNEQEIEKINMLKDNLIHKLSEEELEKNFKNINNPSCGRLIRHYNGLERAKARRLDTLYSPYELFFENKYTESSIRFIKNSDYGHLHMFLHCGRLLNARTVSSYRLNYVQYVIDNYNKNNNWIDFSAGWGERCLGAIKNGVNYYAIDPNSTTLKNIAQMAEDYKRITGKEFFYELNNCGSETYIDGYDNKFGLAFTSPPYYNLETYCSDGQAADNRTFQEFEEHYMIPTLKNLYKYLEDGGFLVINVTNSKSLKNDMEKSWKENAEQVRFKYIKTDKLYQSEGSVVAKDRQRKYESFLIFTK